MLYQTLNPLPSKVMTKTLNLYEADDVSKERERFDELSVELSSRMEAFADLSAQERAVVFGLLRTAARAVPKGGLKELLK